MKGIVFTEFLQLVEEKFGYEVVDEILVSASPENDGAYTSVGTYDYQELIQMVVALSKRVEIPVPVLVKLFGRYLFGKFTKGYTAQIERFNSSFELLESIEGYIHVEVRKLYPKAELPSFEYNWPDENTLEMTYKSSRPFADLCEGLIEECISYYNETVSIDREDLTDDGTSALFRLVRSPVAVSVT